MPNILTVIKRDGSIIEAKVDPQDWDEVRRYRWHMAGGKGTIGKYVTRSDGVYLHRLIAFRIGIIPSLERVKNARGKWTESIDHINGNKLDNRRSNLRVADRKQQMTNRADAVMVTNSSGYEGVSFTQSAPHYPWYASFGVGGKTTSLGTYKTVEEAIAARKAWERTGVVPPPSGRIRPDNTTGVRGVYFAKRQPPLPKPWFSRASVDRKLIHLGYYATKDEAAAARKAWDDSHWE